MEETEFGPFDDKTLVVRPDLAFAQRKREHDERAKPPALTTVTPGPDPTPPPVVPPKPAPRKVVANATFTLRHVVDPSRDMSDDLQTIAQEILALLRGADPDVLDITLTVEAQKADGFDPNTVRAVRQNSEDLGVANSRFGDL